MATDTHAQAIDQPRGWPLWFVGFAFRHTRLAGGLLTLGLLMNLLIPVTLPLPWV